MTSESFKDLRNKTTEHQQRKLGIILGTLVRSSSWKPCLINILEQAEETRVQPEHCQDSGRGPGESKQQKLDCEND